MALGGSECIQAVGMNSPMIMLFISVGPLGVGLSKLKSFDQLPWIKIQGERGKAVLVDSAPVLHLSHE